MRNNHNPLAALAQRGLPALLWTASLLLLWEAGSWALLHVAEVPLAQSKLPYVHEVLAALWQFGGSLLREGGITFANAGAGFLLGAAAGVLLAVLMSLSRTVEQL
ncbi:MAG: ABC transporter permease, partial [Paenibacillus sp.]|nr:ABC transporter permease [Paenibacillus sp.]